jgi:hypothetical protein
MHLKLFVSSLIAGFVTQTALAQYTSIDIGNPQPPGSVTPSGNGYNVTAGGGDIGSSADRFTFNYQTATVTGDFDLKIRVSSLSQADSWTKAGLMGRASPRRTARSRRFRDAQRFGRLFQHPRRHWHCREQRRHFPGELSEHLASLRRVATSSPVRQL